MTCFSLYPHGNLLLSKISKPTTLKTENTNLSILSLEGTPIAMLQANPIIWKMRALRTVKNNRFCSTTISHNHIPSPGLDPEIQTHTATTEQTSLSGYLIGISNLTCSKNPILSFPLLIVCSKATLKLDDLLDRLSGIRKVVIRMFYDLLQWKDTEETQQMVKEQSVVQAIHRQAAGWPSSWSQRGWLNSISKDVWQSMNSVVNEGSSLEP